MKAGHVVGILILVCALGVVRSQQSGSTTPATAKSASAVDPAQTQRYPQFENQDVKVWRSVIQPNAPLAMHRHDHPRVIIALSGGTINIVEQGGPTEKHVWEAGKAYWLPANAPNTKHSDVNVGDKPIEVMVVELEHEK